MDKQNLKQLTHQKHNFDHEHEKDGQFLDFHHAKMENSSEPQFIFQLLKVIFKRKYLIISIVALSFLSSFLFTLSLPKKFTSKVTLMPVSKAGGMGGLQSLAGQFSSLPVVGKSLGSLTGGLGNNRPKELINILKSRTLTEKIISKFNLMPVLFKDQFDSKTGTFSEKFFGFIPIPETEDGVAKFQNKIADISTSKKTNLIEVKISLEDNNLSTVIANAMIVELQDFINNNTLTTEKRNRIFIEKQLVTTRGKLLKAGKELSEFYSKNQVSSVKPDIHVNVGSYQNTPMTLEDFRKKESTEPNSEKDSSKSEIIANVPGQIYLNYLMFNQQLSNKALALLTQQYEMAKIEEAKDDLAFQVIDRATVSIRASSPNLILNVLLGTTAGLFFAIVLALIIEFYPIFKANLK